MHTSRAFFPSLVLFAAMVIALVGPLVKASPISDLAASPLYGDVFVVRGNAPALVGRDEGDLLAMLLDLKADIDSKLAFLDGVNNPVPVTRDIERLLKTWTAKSRALDLQVSDPQDPIAKQASDIVIGIHNDILGAYAKYESPPEDSGGPLGGILSGVLAEIVALQDGVLENLISERDAAQFSSEDQTIETSR